MVFRALRPYHWAKNFLVFVPLLASHNFRSAGVATHAIVALVCMSFCASAIYVVNDLADVNSDRRHHSKRNRPIASGALSRSAGLFVAPLTFASGILLSLLLPRTATLILLVYAALSLAYTFWLKQKLIADVIALSLLYAIRIVEGGAAVSIPVSPWLLAFSLFLLLSFAFSKRVTEMLRNTTLIRSLPGRGYLVSDTSIVASLGVASGYLACLVLSFYISNKDIYALYPHPGWLWLMVPLLLYWIGRFWVLTMRGQMPDDPILFVVNDFVTRVSLICGAVVVFLAMKGSSGIPGITE